MKAAVKLVKEGGADMLKLDAAAGYSRKRSPRSTRAGIPVFAQFGLTPQTALKYGIPYSAQNSASTQATAEMTDKAGGGSEDAGSARARRCSTSPIPARSPAPPW